MGKKEEKDKPAGVVITVGQLAAAGFSADNAPTPIQRLMDQPFQPAVGFRVLRQVKKIEPEIGVYLISRRAVYEQFGEDNGKGGLVIPAGKVEEANQALVTLHAEEVKLTITPLGLDILDTLPAPDKYPAGKSPITPGEMYPLSFLFEADGD